VIAMSSAMKMLMFAALAILMAAACVMIAENSGEADAISDHGSSSSPLNSFTATGTQLNSDSNNSYYVKVGGSVSITLGSSGSYSYYPNTVTSGYGLTKGNGSVSGTISKAGTISVGLVRENASGNVSTMKTITIYAVNASSSTTYTEKSFSWNVGDSVNALLGPGEDFTGSVPGVTISVFVNAGTPFVKAVGSPTTAGTYVVTTDSNYRFTITVTGSSAPTQYTCYLYYNANGGSGAPSTQSYTGTSTSSHSFTVASGTPTKSGYTFLGWATSSGATTASYQAGSSISVSYNGSKTLYAVWQQDVVNYTVTVYKGNWDSFQVLGVDTDVVTASSKSYTVESGKRFDVDWYGAQDETGSGTNYTYTVSYDSGCYNMASSLYGTSLGDSVTVTKTTKYYPAEEMGSTTTYSYQYTIKYSANGGSGAPSNTTATASTTTKSITLSSTVPTRSGYTFLGWSTSSSATSATYQAGTAYSFNYGTTQLYAVWKQATITVSGTPDTYGVVGSSWSFKPTVSVSGCSVTVSGANWLSANGTNISGTPTSPGTYNVTLTFSKTGYTNAVKTFTITVLSALDFTSSPTGGAIIYAV